MRFLQLVVAGRSSGPRDAEHVAKMRRAIDQAVADGVLLATGGVGRRDTAAARITRKDGAITVEDPPAGDGWMAAGGYSLTEHPSKADAIAAAARTLETMGEGVLELIQVSEMYPPAGQRLAGADASPHPAGVVPYLTFDGASEAAAFYARAFGAREIARMPAEDGVRLMHCHLEINGGALMLADRFPELGAGSVQRSESYTMQLVVADGQTWWSRAVEAGCTVKLPFEVAPWGDRYGQLIDPFGVTWALSSPAT